MKKDTTYHNMLHMLLSGDRLYSEFLADDIFDNKTEEQAKDDWETLKGHAYFDSINPSPSEEIRNETKRFYDRILYIEGCMLPFAERQP